MPGASASELGVGFPMDSELICVLIKRVFCQIGLCKLQEVANENENFRMYTITAGRCAGRLLIIIIVIITT
jgi:hypothetical protein